MRYVLALTLILASFTAMADIEPVDGLWSHETRLVSIGNCPPHFSQGHGIFQKIRIKHSKPYHPSGRQRPNETWERLGENRWSGIRTESKESQDGLQKVETKYLITVNSPHHITQENAITVTLPKTIAQAMGMSGTTCTMSSILETHHLSD